MNYQRIFEVEFYTLANQLVPYYLEKEGYDLDLDYLQMRKLNEASQFWIVSNWLANRFEEKGELILEILDFSIWCRSGCGYSVLIDIENIMEREEDE